MKKQFATYEIALALKKLGFGEQCFGYYNDTNTDPEISLPVAVDVVCLKFNLVKAPIWQQVIDFFRDEFGIVILISPNEKFSESHLNNWINFRKIHYYYEIFRINKREIDMDDINKARIMIGDKSTDKLVFTDDSIVFSCGGVLNDFYTAREEAILKAIELIKN